MSGTVLSYSATRCPAGFYPLDFEIDMEGKKMVLFPTRWSGRLSHLFPSSTPTSYGILLRTPLCSYALPGTDVWYDPAHYGPTPSWTMVLCTCLAVSGTDVGYGATRCLCYESSGTDLGYGVTRQEHDKVDARLLVSPILHYAPTINVLCSYDNYAKLLRQLCTMLLRVYYAPTTVQYAPSTGVLCAYNCVVHLSVYNSVYK
eukprot:3756826-Rhodomonas_salina.1